jgi:hypothetical protein
MSNQLFAWLRFRSPDFLREMRRGVAATAARSSSFMDDIHENVIRDAEREYCK